MKHISLITLLVAFSINSFAKSILCASKDHSIVVSVSTEDQVNSQGYLQANSMMIQRNLANSRLIETKDVIGGIDVEAGYAGFNAEIKEISSSTDVSKVQLDMGHYKEGKGIVLKGVLKIDKMVGGPLMIETHVMKCITHLEVGI